MNELTGGEAQLLIVALVVSLWSIPWKAFALWKSARNGSKVWFVVLLIFNTVAILEILYIFVFSKRNEKSNPTISSRPKV